MLWYWQQRWSLASSTPSQQQQKSSFAAFPDILSFCFKRKRNDLVFSCLNFVRGIHFLCDEQKKHKIIFETASRQPSWRVPGSSVAGNLCYVSFRVSLPSCFLSLRHKLTQIKWDFWICDGVKPICICFLCSLRNVLKKSTSSWYVVFDMNYFSSSDIFFSCLFSFRLGKQLILWHHQWAQLCSTGALECSVTLILTLWF